MFVIVSDDELKKLYHDITLPTSLIRLLVDNLDNSGSMVRAPRSGRGDGLVGLAEPGERKRLAVVRRVTSEARTRDPTGVP
jgi:hypothetical protein